MGQITKTAGATRAISLCIAASLLATGCATASKDIAATYVSPIQYQSYDCPQLVAELQRISGRVSQIGGRLDEAASNDKMITGAGVILFWPALFFIGGTKAQEQEYSRLKGEYDAVNQVAIQKKCDRPTAPAASTPTPSATPASSATEKK